MQRIIVAVLCVIPLVALAGEFSIGQGFVISVPKPRPWLSPEPFPKGMVRYETATQSQRIGTTNNFTVHHIDRIWISSLDSKWQQSGGMEGVKGWKSDKFKLLPKAERYWIGTIDVWNGRNYQQNRGIKREYANGTRFDDVLANDDGVVFEHRSRFKRDGKWESIVLHKDTAARPKGYVGLKVTCNSCHNAEDGPGTGGYETGLVQGGDGVFSDPLDWAVWER